MSTHRYTHNQEPSRSQTCRNWWRQNKTPGATTDGKANTVMTTGPYRVHGHYTLYQTLYMRYIFKMMDK